MTARGPSPADRVRARLAPLPPDAAALLPRGYQRLGRVLVLRLPEALRPRFAEIGAAWQEVLGVATVLRHAGRTVGEDRHPAVEVIAGGPTETEVREHGVRYGFDAAAVMFAAGNKSERRRAGLVVRPGETVVDLFAGIGYFTLPAARPGGAARVVAVERNPVAYRYLVANLHSNGVADRVEAILGDNRGVPLPRHAADRVFMGYLPSALPWVRRALSVARPGATLHVHLVGDSRGGPAGAAAQVARALAAEGVEDPALDGRTVKPYGPGRTHFVVDATLPGPAPGP